jgi:hypothetical protein
MSKKNKQGSQRTGSNPLAGPQMPPMEDLMKMISQMSSQLNVQNDAENLDLDNMVDQFTGILGANMDPAIVKNIGDVTKGFMKNMVPAQEKQPSVSKIHLPELESPKDRSNSHKPVRLDTPMPPKMQECPDSEESEGSHKGPLMIMTQEGPIMIPDTERNYELLDDSEDIDPFNPRTKDMIINLPVSLEELYTGHEKKIAIKRDRIKKDTLVEERKKIVVSIEPGMKDEQVIRYTKQSSEDFGHDTGDIIVILKQNNHEYFERESNNLFVCKNIGLYESYAAAMNLVTVTIIGLDGTVMILDTKGIPLHEGNGHRKVAGFGMPIYKPRTGHGDHRERGDQERGDLFIRFNLVLPKTIDKKVLHGLKTVFPLVSEDTIEGTEVPADVPSVVAVLEELTEEDLKNFNDEEASEYSDEYSEE